MASLIVGEVFVMVLRYWHWRARRPHERLLRGTFVMVFISVYFSEVSRPNRHRYSCRSRPSTGGFSRSVASPPFATFALCFLIFSLTFFLGSLALLLSRLEVASLYPLPSSMASPLLHPIFYLFDLLAMDIFSGEFLSFPGGLVGNISGHTAASLAVCSFFL